MRKRLILITPFVAMLALVGCAVSRPPSADIAAATQAIAAAEKARAAEGAATELGTARDLLAKAQAAMDRKEPIAGRHLAERSRVEAEYAIVKAELVRAAAVNDEMKKSNQALQQEMQRNTGARP